MLSRMATQKVGVAFGRRALSTSSRRCGPTIAGTKDLIETYGKQWVAVGGLFGCAAMVHLPTAVCVGSFFAAAHLVDLVVNDDLDDLLSLPRTTYNHMCGPAKERKKVVVLGSGWGALSFVRKLDPMVFDVTVISPRNFFFYTPLLAGVTTSTVKTHSILEPVRQTKPMPYARFLQAECTGLDANKQTIVCQGGGNTVDVHYDHLLVAVGTQPNTFGIPGVLEHALFLKELHHGLEVRQRILDRLERAVVAHEAGQFVEVRRLLTIVVVGGGPTGIEFAAEVADLINTDVKRSFASVADQLNVTVVEAQADLLSMFEPAIGKHVKEHLRDVGVKVLTETAVNSVDDKSITFKTKAGSETLGYGLLVWTAGVGPRPITKNFSAELGQSNPRGLEVDECLRVKGSTGNQIFAIGDCTVSGNAWTAQVAAQQGKYLARAFRDEGASPSKPFVYDHQGTMAYVGDGSAVAVLTPPNPGEFTSKFSRASFFRQLASCDDALLKPEFQTGTVQAKPKKTVLNVLGLRGFAVWRGVYFTKLFSYSNRFNVATDWIRNFFFGRVVASSVQSFKP